MTAPKSGWLTSEFSTLLGAWLGVQAMPEHLVWPTTVVACVYILSRSLVKMPIAHQNAPQQVQPIAPPPAPPQTAGESGKVLLTGVAQGLAVVALSAALLTGGGCKALGDVLAQPIEQPAVVQGPEGVTPAPVNLELPAGAGEVTYTPPAAPEQPTVGSEVGSAIGGVVGAVSGNPALGAVLSLVLAGVMGRAGRRKG